MDQSQLAPGHAQFTGLDLGRLESFGDNCELGFVLRRLGWEDGSLFRWSSIAPESLLATLRGDFAGLYDFEQLEPHRRSMVLDRRYGTAWHSGMTASPGGGAWAFDHDPAVRRSIHAGESAKRAHLVGKLHRKFEHPNPVFVIKRNAGISPEVLEGIHYQLFRRTGSPAFAMLEMCADPGRAGQLERLGPTLFRGFVGRFASYEDAENGDDLSWRRVLAGVLAHGAAPVEPHGRQHPITLPFPPGSPALDRIIQGDLRAGYGVLLRGNEWCRLVDDDMYRLHADATGVAATMIQWTGIQAPDGWRLSLRAGLAIANSKPVRLTLHLADGSGASAVDTCLVDAVPPRRLTFAAPPGAVRPLSVWLVVEPQEALKPGERAVIDLAPIDFSPDVGSVSDLTGAQCSHSVASVA